MRQRSSGQLETTCRLFRDSEMCSFLKRVFLQNKGHAANGALTNSLRRLSRRKEGMDGFRASLPSVIIVDQNEAAGHDSVPELLQTNHGRFIPVGIEPKNCDGRTVESRDRMFKKPLMNLNGLRLAWGHFESVPEIFD